MCVENTPSMRGKNQIWWEMIDIKLFKTARSLLEKQLLSLLMLFTFPGEVYIAEDPS